MATTENIWIVLETPDLEEVHLEMVTKAREIADHLGQSVSCIAMGRPADGVIKEVGDYGADTLCFLDRPTLKEYCAETAESHVEALVKALEGQVPKKLLFADTLAGRDLACRFAALLKVGIVTGCVELRLAEKGLIEQAKPLYEGRAIGAYVYRDPVLEIATIKPGALDKEKWGSNRTIETRPLNLETNSFKPRVRTTGFLKAGPDDIGLDEADIIVTGGRGMGSIENFQILYRLAKELGGTTAGSLAAVDEGWVPRNRLVGQTGMSVEPKLYIACGVSGSIYHIMGMRDAKTIIAINKDRHAPIFKYADFGIVGDVMEIIPLILDHFGKLQKELETGSAGDNA